MDVSLFQNPDGTAMETQHVVHKLTVLAKCRHKDQKHQCRVATMAAALSVADGDVNAMAHAVSVAGFNLLHALPPQTLGRAIQTGLIGADNIRKWASGGTVRTQPCYGHITGTIFRSTCYSGRLACHSG